jgi:heme O synthase-like polyprenyltransferase
MAGPGYLVAALAMGLAFLGFGIHCAVGKRRADARRLFLVSIIYLPALLAVMMLDKVARGA